MDGYAISTADLRGAGGDAAISLAIEGEVRIGQAPPGLPRGRAVRIVTGGAIPAGTDAVIKREDVREHADRIDLPTGVSIAPGENIRRAGENAAQGQCVLRQFTRITPAVAGALATLGISRPSVCRPLAVGIITTGDELVGIHESPTPWQIRDSNAASLRALITSLRVAEVRHTRVRDDEHRLANAVSSHLRTCDALILTGGVSMGHRDFVADAVTAAGATVVFHGLPQRPGKPILAAATPDGKPILALPGNPVSVLVTGRRYAVPAIRLRGSGTPPASLDSGIRVSLSNADSKSIPLWWHRPVRLNGDGTATVIDTKSSGDILGVAQSDGFVEIPPNQSGPGPWAYFGWTP